MPVCRLFVFLASHEMYTGNYHHDDICLNVTSASREMEDASRCNRQSFWITKRKAAARMIEGDHLALLCLFEFRMRWKIVVNAMSFRSSRVLCRLTSPSERKALMCLLYWSSIWLQMFFIWYDYREKKTEREREKLASSSFGLPYQHHNNIAWRFHLPPVATNQATFASRDCWSVSRHLFFHSSFSISTCACVPCSALSLSSSPSIIWLHLHQRENEQVFVSVI